MSLREIVLFFCFFGAVQGTLLGAALLSVGRREPRQWVLGLFVLGGAATMAVISLSHSGSVDGMHLLLQAVEYTLIAAMAPLLYLYVFMAARRLSRVPRWMWFHSTPVLAWLGYLLWWLMFERSRGGEPFWPPFGPTVLFQVAYTALAVVTYRRRRLDGDIGPSLPGETRFFCRFLLGFMIALHGAQLLRLSLIEVEALRNIVPLVGSLGFCAFTIVGIRHSPLMQASSTGQARSRKGGLEQPRDEREAQRLVGLLVEQRRFLDEGLTLGTLAEELSLSRTYLSRLINRRFGQGFLELVNGYRVAEARRLLRDPGTEHLTIDAVASRAGFRSRSTFYDAFRRATGTTPSSYRSDRQAT